MAQFILHLVRDGKLSCPDYYPDFTNSNALTLSFSSKDQYADQGSVTVFSLDAVTAECLARIGQMDPAQRAAALPHLQRIMNPEEFA